MEEKTLTDELYFTFKLGTGKYAVEVTQVKEVLNFESVTKVPKALPYMKGVMNIRGSVVTVIDLRILFGFEASGDLADTDIIVTEINRGAEQPITVGLIADEVDVVTKLERVHSDSVAFGSMPQRTDFIQAVGKLDDAFVLILDLGRILASIEAELSGK